ncbi:MAG: MATE family efflux transporter [Eubacteriales bacterium]|nr:MATE family efflux transporter [Eubacteriales bacterium]
MQKDLTRGNVFRVLVRFSLPYLLSCFLQTFYGLADLFITGQFNGAASISAVSVGSQVMHMLTVIIVGLAMGSTVTISHGVGERNMEKAGKAVGNTVTLFLLFSLALTAILLLGVERILVWISIPSQALPQARLYLQICFAGIPAITAYNIISCIFRGMGDSKSPLYFVAAACVLNVVLDYVLIGGMAMGAAGAALGTVISQTVSVLLALAAVRRKSLGIRMAGRDLRPDGEVMGGILRIGIPIAFQDGLIQVSFMIITIIANRRGVTAAASVGIVEKLISFFFLVPSAMLSSISSIVAQNEGAGKYRRGERTLWYGVATAVSFGALVAVICQFFSPQILSLFTQDQGVVVMGTQYLKAYVLDCIVAGVHFCFSGYFCAYGWSGISFWQNVVSIVLLRVPGAYLASKFYPDTLFPMGLAAPAGSLLSALICVAVFGIWHERFLPREGVGG